ncbi:MAG: hypothetical protein IT324_30645 [Anaerolineae bacterium]|nr:hypothetical protein [Anaerolineae bacterium]
MKPLTEFVDRTSLTAKLSFAERAEQKLKLLVGRYIYAAYLTYSCYAETQTRANAPKDHLSDSEIEALTVSEVANLNAHRKKKYNDRSVDSSFQGLVIPLIDAIIERDPGVTSVVDVAARYALTAHELAVRYPNITFTCISFATNAAEYNAELARPNLKFATGYALDLLERGEVQGDVVVFGSTGPVIPNRELRRYFRCIGQHSKYVVLNEPIFNRFDGTAVDPDTVPVDKSVPAYEHWNNFIHNYRAMVTEAGFDVIHYDLFPVPEYLGRSSKHHILQLIAVNPHVK